MKSALLKKSIAVGLVAMACGAASATTTNLGAIPLGPPTPFSGTVIPAGPFVDVFTFTLPANGGSGYSVVNFPLSVPGFGTFNTVFSSLALISNPNGILFDFDDVGLATASGVNAPTLGLSWGGTTGGSMYLTVSGVANGSIGAFTAARSASRRCRNRRAT